MRAEREAALSVQALQPNRRTRPETAGPSSGTLGQEPVADCGRQFGMPRRLVPADASKALSPLSKGSLPRRLGIR